MERPNYRKGSIIFDDDTILQVEQRGGGGSGVGGETGLAAVNLKTGESTNAALAEKDETIAEQAETIETQAGTIEEQAATIETQAATITEQAEQITELEGQLTNAYVKQPINITWINNKSEAVDLYDYSTQTTVPDRMDGLGVVPGRINAGTTTSKYQAGVFRKTSINIIELTPVLMLSGSRILNTCSVSGSQVDNPDLLARINDQHIILYNVAANTKVISITVTIPA